MSPRYSLRSQRTPSGDRKARCPTCLLQPRVCLCGLLAPLALETRVVVFRHRREVHKPTNTGRLATLALQNAELRTFGGRDEPFDDRGLDDLARRTLLLYPADDARPIERDERDPRPVTLLVPDADWRRAYKLAMHEPKLACVPRVRLPAGPPSTYRLRWHPDPRFLATFEGVARALGVLEGDGVRVHLEALFRAFVERMLTAREGAASTCTPALARALQPGRPIEG